jgi:hypothetical protein
MWVAFSGTWLPNWRRRYFILKDGKLMWFKHNIITPVRLLVVLADETLVWLIL